jgi:hypothetical protein
MIKTLILSASFATLISTMIVGCGSGDSRIPLSGTVTFNGQPIAFGEVVFRPETGPEGSATICDGKFDTTLESGRGITPGPNRLLVTGYEFEPLSIADEAVNIETSPPLFINYELQVDISGKTHDIVVPADAINTAVQESDGGNTGNEP